MKLGLSSVCKEEVLVMWRVPAPALLDDHAARQMLGVVFEEFGCGAGAVGQFQLLQLLELNQAW